VDKFRGGLYPQTKIGSRHDASQTQEAAEIEFLSKPFSPSKLAAKVREVFGK